ncbi:hypothetical protein AWB79_04453 [Caballeronia hypogeia]|uniref:Uncharacterized protein n=1 Tax=Caballeronia hypogeia TaxID=1777140 RepID=A0A158BZ67_9BURK|nr:hypothetical protein [Caballeronia hypogeia]SAK75398.1 hypothetical protein AWB79_04453 [Caballeronia hypogeia]
MHGRVRKLDMPVDVGSLKLAVKHCDELHQPFLFVLVAADVEIRHFCNGVYTRHLTCCEGRGCTSWLSLGESTSYGRNKATE